MGNKKTIRVEDNLIQVVLFNNEDYISLTDMARSQLQEVIIIKWLSLKSTIDYPGEWEILYNPDFNYNYSHSGVLTKDGKVKSKFGKGDLKETTDQEVEGKYGPRTEIYKKIPDKKLSKDRLKPGKTSNGTRELKSREINKLQDSGVISQ